MELTQLFPVQCYSCGFILSDKQESYNRLVAQGIHPGEAMTRLGIKRYCCRKNTLCPAILPLGPAMAEEDFNQRSVEPQRMTSILASLNAINNVGGLDAVPPTNPSELAQGTITPPRRKIIRRIRAI